ncbi:hypothetical protein BUALT_Bualt14G0052100 [Buddleja alternifolia]|uniref:Uncharacterized protein n=1 Tax=Buddleja alternifolia TaxID=168488 RepID=A0AAV6WF30_9LAMI|nr:hypothetical protein BUALT_Bualt14G0052100 [Buddleja alternifolia]
MHYFTLEPENEQNKINMAKDGRNEEITVQYSIESLESKGESGNKSPLEQTLVSNIRRSRVNPNCRELFVPNSIHPFHNSIPKHITTFDEKYVLRCLELIRNCALRTAALNFASKVDVLPHDCNNNLTEIGGSYDMTIGPITGSQSMINILKSPLLQQYGSLDFDLNFGKTSSPDVGEPIYSDFVGPPRELRNMLSHKPQKEVTVVDHKRVVSISSTNSTFSDISSSSGSALSFQGMLQCTWRDGLPRHVFTVDDKREVYVANLSKVESLDDKALDYVYTFHSRKRGKKECDVHELDLESVGKMRVSTSITFGCNNSKIRETRFILSVISNDDPTVEMQMSNHTVKKNKRLTRKVVDVFRSTHSHKKTPSSKFGGSSAIFEDTPWEPSEDAINGHDLVEAGGEKNYIPNLEMAAMIVKDVCKNHEEADIGGWGLKFLKKSRKVASKGTFECTRDDRECSTSMDILIPAGLHGGPKTRVGGPSSLTERWMAGGRCDCGGWDIGCPLTVLNTRSGSTESSSHADSSGECETVDLFMQGSKHDVPMLKMVNIHEGLYYIHFQSTVSTLQSFAIAAAIIHSRSPVLRSKVYRS